jgi:hypothetical protein
MSPYAEYLLARPPKPALTATQAAKPARHYQPPADWGAKYLYDLSKSIDAGCERFWARRGLASKGDW